MVGVTTRRHDDHDSGLSHLNTIPLELSGWPSGEVVRLWCEEMGLIEKPTLEWPVFPPPHYHTLSNLPLPNNLLYLAEPEPIHWVRL